MPLVVGLLAAVVAVVVLVQKAAAQVSDGESMVPTVDDLGIKQAIRDGITVPEGLPDVATDILYFQAERETGNFKAWYFQGPQPDGLPPTFNLFNRRVGSGKGEWTGQVKMIGKDDTRIFSDVRQSARDFDQWLNDLGASTALPALQKGDGAAYFAALEALGFSARKGDYLAYAGQWKALA